MSHILTSWWISHCHNDYRTRFFFVFEGSISNQFNPFFAFSSEILWLFSLRDDVWWLNDDFSGEGFFLSVRGRPSWSVHVAIKTFLILMTHQSMGRKFPTTLRISSSSGRTHSRKWLIEKSCTGIWKIDILVILGLSYHFLSLITAGSPFPAGNFYRVFRLPAGELISSYQFLFEPVGIEFFVGLSC